MALRLLCFSDLHLDVSAAKRLAGLGLVSNVDFLVSSGDLALDGRHDPALYRAFDWAARPVLAVPGNHDGDEPYRSVIQQASWMDLDGSIHVHEEWALAGWGIRYLDPGWSGPDAHAQEDDSLLGLILQRLESHPPERVVLVTHLPPFGTLASRDAKLVERGNVQLRRWIDQFQPAAVLCGHVHHREAVVEQLGRTVIVNAGPHGHVLAL